MQRTFEGLDKTPDMPINERRSKTYKGEEEIEVTGTKTSTTQ